MVNAELESLGILRQTKIPDYLDWMTDDEKRFMLLLYEAGEGGLHKRVVISEEKRSADLALRLTAYNVAYWERDKFGREMYLTLTYKGQEAAELLLRVARNATRSTFRPKSTVVADSSK